MCILEECCLRQWRLEFKVTLLLYMASLFQREDYSALGFLSFVDIIFYFSVFHPID